MICPNCKYENTPRSGNSGYEVLGDEGPFFLLGQEAVRTFSPLHPLQTLPVVACPKCSVVFVNQSGD